MMYNELLKEIEQYIKMHKNAIYRSLQSMVYEEDVQVEVEDYINKFRKPPLNQILFQLIDQKGMKDSEVYKRAGIDRRHFSKIRTNSSYKPKKNTIISLALALELDKDETEELLQAAGYAFSDNDTHDLIIQFFLEKQLYDIGIINEVLDHFRLRPLRDD
mgnify:FL=1